MDEDIQEDDRYEVHEISNINPTGEDDLEGDDIAVDDSSVTFSGHQEPVFCIDILKGSTIVLTGGQDEVSYVWDANTKEELAKIEGHKDSIASVSFHASEKCLATADMLGLIQVFSTETKQKIWSYECGRDLELLFWHPLAKVLFAGVSDGDLYMLKVGTDEMKCYSGGGCGISSAKLSSAGTEALVGYNDGTVKCWNLKACTVISTCKLSTNTENPVLEISVSMTSPDQYFACHAEAVCLVHMKTGKILSSFSDTDMSFFTSQSNQQSSEESDSSIQTFSLCPSHKNLLVLGRNNGAVETWDTSAKCPRNANQVTGAVTKIVFPPLSQEPICLIATSSGSVFCFDSLTGSVLRKFQGHSDAIHDLILSDDETFFVTCSDDCTVKLFLLS